MTSIRPAIFLDFDGTITIGDATDAILEAYADPQWLRIEDAWKAGRIGSRECLAAQMALVTASRREVDALLDEIEIDPGFAMLLERCAARALPVHIVSDGFDYCIERILGRPSLQLTAYLSGMRIVSSHLETDDARWLVGFTSPRPSCVHGCATCKPAEMERLNECGAPVIFTGDGLSDRGELLRVLAIDAGWQGGSADAALGQWYYELPRFLGGSRKKAEEHQRRALAYDEQNLVALVSLADVPADDDRSHEARMLLQRVLDAPIDAEWAAEDRDFKKKAAEKLKSLAR